MTSPSISNGAKIEAVLFFKAEPVSIKKLGSILGVDDEEVQKCLVELENKLEDRGIVLVRKDDEVELQTAKPAAGIIENLTKEDLTREIGRAGLEVLSIVLYRGPITKRDIDYVRGVNSSLVIRNLLIRNLVEREEGRDAYGSFIYKPTFKLMSHLGLKRLDELPEYAEVRREIEEFETKKNEDSKKEGVEQMNEGNS